MSINSKTIFTGDNLPIMRGMNSESVDLIYLDPPFNSNANYAAPIGSEAAGAEFKDTWTLNDVDAAWLDLIEAKHPQLNRVIHAAMSNSDKSYLIYMAVRLLEMHRILKDSGSIYLHCDPTMSHYLKLVMDTIFGKQHFQNEIIWCYERGSRRKSQFGRKHDVILFYSKTKNYVFDSDAVRVERRKTHMKVETDLEGRTWQVKKDAKSGKVYRYSTDVGVLCPDWWIGIQQLNRNEKRGLATQPKNRLRCLTASSKPHQTRDMLFSIRSVGVPQHLLPRIGFNAIGSVLTYQRKPPSWLLNVSKAIKACLKTLLHATTYPTART